ncbi:MAG: alginate O-acetyltransferase complex protein AlgI, partial [Psychroserpens sp.]
MLFNSYEFIFAFIPLMLMLYILSNHYASKTVSLLVLVLGSLFFYGWWNPTFVLLISCSILFNFYLGRYLANSKSKLILIFGITSNLLLIGYFKYFNFFGESLSAVFNSSFNASQIILPLAISFFTFQQIAFLVDCYKNKGREDSLLRYSLFITFFPQLIAGPIVHHKEMLPQFEGDLKKNINTLNILIGLSIFSIGLFKKTVIADGIAPYANAVFYKAGIGGDIGFFEAWSGALAYTFQLYFDFSGYSDMALGIARMFGIILPLNFYSPYKASNISEFWRRWHMTLSRFLRDYLYIALGGNRQGPNRRQINLIITMLLGGLWHGAGWNFVIWGGLHGLYLVIFHVYSSVTEKVFASRIKMPSMIAWTLTFLAVVLSWVFFRATTPGSALTIINGMVGINGVTVPNAIM